jgi:hypothetical protein
MENKSKVHEFIMRRDGFEDTTFEAKAKDKARQVRGQGQDQGQSQIGSRLGRGQNWCDAASINKKYLYVLHRHDLFR